MRRRQREEEEEAGFTCTCKIHSANQGGVLNHLTVVIHDHLKREEFQKSVFFVVTTTDLVSRCFLHISPQKCSRFDHINRKPAATRSSLRYFS